MNDLETLPQPLSLNVRVIVDALPVLELIDLGRTRHFTCASLMVSIVIVPSWTKIRECLTCQYDKSVSMNQWGINVLTAAVARPSPPTSFPMGRFKSSIPSSFQAPRRSPTKSIFLYQVKDFDVHNKG